MYLGKARIRDMARYINRVESDINFYRDTPQQAHMYSECVGAYFAALKMAELAGVESEVHKVREELKERVPA